jgi:N-dimethylarginine dimethylaminohydrolase
MKIEGPSSASRMTPAQVEAPTSRQRARPLSWDEAASTPAKAGLAARGLRPRRFKTPALAVESARGKDASYPDLEALRLLLDVHYKDLFTHPRFHYHAGAVDLAGLSGERYSETDPIRAVVLSPPYALGSDQWRYSPLASVEAPSIDVHGCLADHARLARTYLEQGVDVHFVVHPQRASQAVYSTDTVTRIGKLAVIGNPLYWERQLETFAYEGAVRMRDYGASAPVEWGDVQLAFRAGKLYVLQGLNSQRSNDASFEALGRMLHTNRKRLGCPYEHLPIYLRQVTTPQAHGTLHLDYVLGQAGAGDRRALVVVPEGLADAQRTIGLLQSCLAIADERIVTADTHEMAHGATNLSSLSPERIIYSASPALERVADALRRLDIDVTPLPMPGLAALDGNAHCATGQLARALPTDF